MVDKLPVVSGHGAIKVLTKLGFEVARQRGSHVALKKNHFVVSVPLHKNIKKGTLKAILKQAGISLDEFNEKL